jgi:hypothetical protein
VILRDGKPDVTVAARCYMGIVFVVLKIEHLSVPQGIARYARHSGDVVRLIRSFVT